MLPARTFALDQIAAAGGATTRIAFSVRVGCARALRMLHASQAPRDEVWEQLEAAACLPPLDQVPVARLQQQVASNADAILGCGSAQTVAAFAALLPSGATPAKVPTLGFHAALAHMDPNVLATATRLFEPESLLSQAFLATIGQSSWAGFWRARLPELARFYLPSTFWMSGQICTLAGGADAALHVEQVRGLITQRAGNTHHVYMGRAIPRAPKPDTVGALAWLERAAFAHLLAPEIAEAYPLLSKAKAMDVDAAVADTDAWLASRAIWRQADGHAPWGTDPVRFLLTPSAQRAADLLGLIAPVWEAPKTAASTTAPTLPRRGKAIKALVADGALALTFPALLDVARHYTKVVDIAIATHDATLRDAALAEAQTMRGLLQRAIGAAPRQPYERATVDGDGYGVLMATGARAFLHAGKACAHAAYPPQEWTYAASSFGRNEKLDVEALIRRAEVDFMAEIVPQLNRTDTWKALVFAQHKPKMIGPLLDALDTDETMGGCAANEGARRHTHLGAALDYGKGRGHMGIGFSRALWDIQDPDLRVEIFRRLEKGNGFYGVPGKNLESYEAHGAGPDLLLLHTMRHAHRQGQSFEAAGRHVDHPCLVRDLIQAGKGTAFFQRFSSLEGFVATPWERIEAIAAELLGSARLA